MQGRANFVKKTNVYWIKKTEQGLGVGDSSKARQVQGKKDLSREAKYIGQGHHFRVAKGYGLDHRWGVLWEVQAGIWHVICFGYDSVVFLSIWSRRVAHYLPNCSHTFFEILTRHLSCWNQFCGHFFFVVLKPVFFVLQCSKIARNCMNAMAFFVGYHKFASKLLFLGDSLSHENTNYSLNNGLWESTSIACSFQRDPMSL